MEVYYHEGQEATHTPIMKGKRPYTRLWMITTSEYITKLKRKQGRRKKNGLVGRELGAF
jgi:hypothetical protein